MLKRGRKSTINGLEMGVTIGGDAAKSVKNNHLLVIMRVRIGTDGCNLSHGCNLRNSVGIMCIDTQSLLFESNIRCQRSTLLLIVSHKYINCYALNAPSF